MFLNSDLRTFDPDCGIMKYPPTVWWTCVGADKGIHAKTVLKSAVRPDTFNHYDPGLLTAGDFNVDDDFAASISNPYPVALLYVKTRCVGTTQLNSRARFFFN